MIVWKECINGPFQGRINYFRDYVEIPSQTAKKQNEKNQISVNQKLLLLAFIIESLIKSSSAINSNSDELKWASPKLKTALEVKRITPPTCQSTETPYISAIHHVSAGITSKSEPPQNAECLPVPGYTFIL